MINNFTFNYCFQRLIPELKLVALGVRHLPSHQSSTSNNLIYIWAKLKYNTLDIVSQVPLLNCCHLYSLITQLTSVNTISFCFFLPPFFFFFFSWPARNLFIKSLKLSHQMAKDDQSMEISDDQRHTHSRDALPNFIFLDGVSESTDLQGSA